jgi:hypothetical protein
MTDKLKTKKSESFSSIEVFSVTAVTLVLVMVAVPEAYVNRNRALPAFHAASGGATAADDTGNWDALQSTGAGNNADSAGGAAQGSPFEVRTVGRREFCADMPGVVRFSTKGPSCKNGTVVTNALRRREQQARP